MKRCALLLAGIVMTGAVAAGPLKPFEASYAFIWSGFTAGVSTFSLKQDSDQQWTYTSRNQPHGLARLYSKASWTLSSQMTIGPDGVRPLVYKAADPDNGAIKGEVRFDWGANRAPGTQKGRTSTWHCALGCKTTCPCRSP